LKEVHHCSAGSPLFVAGLWAIVQFLATATLGRWYLGPTAQL